MSCQKLLNMPFLISTISSEVIKNITSNKKNCSKSLQLQKSLIFNRIPLLINPLLNIVHSKQKPTKSQSIFFLQGLFQKMKKVKIFSMQKHKKSNFKEFSNKKNNFKTLLFKTSYLNN